MGLCRAAVLPGRSCFITTTTIHIRSEEDAIKHQAKIDQLRGITPEVRRLREIKAGVITASVGLGVSTFVMATLKGHNKENIDKFIAAIKRINEIVECHHITGSGDFILKIVCADIASYQQLMLDKVSNIEVVDSLQSMVILSTFKDSKALPIIGN